MDKVEASIVRAIEAVQTQAPVAFGHLVTKTVVDMWRSEGLICHQVAKVDL